MELVATILLGLANILLAVFVLPMRRKLSKMQDNELAHLKETLDNVADNVTEIGKKLDGHIQWHLDSTRQQ